MGNTKVKHSGYRSLFWPIVLIGVGVVWLLGNLGVLTASSLIVVARLWPLLLILIGLDLLFGRQSPTVGALLGLGAVVLIVVLMLIGPSLGLAGPQLDVQTTTLSEPRGDATAASVNMAASVGSFTITALSDSPNLFEADIRHVGELNFNATGETNKSIRLSENEVQNAGNFNIDLGIFGAAFENRDELRWDIGLSPDVPLALTVNSGVGRSMLDLSALQVTSLDLNAGVGEVELRLPALAESYPVSVNSGVGQTDITIAPDAALTMTLNGGVGATTIDVPDGAAVRINATGGLGGVNVPDSFTRTSGGDGSFDQGSGTWESAGYASADRRIEISFSGGVGGLTLR